MKQKRVLIVSLMLMALLSTIVFGAGVGLAPSTIKFEDVLRNREYIKSFKVDVLNAPAPVIVHIELSGEVADWLDTVDKFELPEGTTYNTYNNITLKVPKRTPIGEYNGKLRVKLEYDTGDGIGIIPGVTGDIEVKVTKEVIRDVKIDHILTQDIEQCDPYVTRSGVINYGNVPARLKFVTNITKSDETVTQFTKVFKLNVGESKTLKPTYQRTCNWEKHWDYRAVTKVYHKQGKEWVLVAENNPRFKVNQFNHDIVIPEQTIIIDNPKLFRRALKWLGKLGIVFEVIE